MLTLPRSAGRPRPAAARKRKWLRQVPTSLRSRACCGLGRPALRFVSSRWLPGAVSKCVRSKRTCVLRVSADTAILRYSDKMRPDEHQIKPQKLMRKLAAVFPWLTALFTVAASPALQAAWIEEEIPTNGIQVTASSEYGSDQRVKHLIDGSGIKGDGHDNDGTSRTMWHTKEKPAPTSPAPGLPASPAWVRFDFASPQRFDSISIWNHNQANLTERGFRRTRIFGSVDGSAWIPLTTPEVIELPRANGNLGLEATVIANAAKNQGFKSVIIAADAKDGNYGGDVYGLSEVRFGKGHEVAEADIPLPTGMACAALPYCPYRADGQPGREIAISLRGGKLYGEVTFDVECAGAKERTTVAANPRGASSFSILLPASVNITNDYDATVELHSGRAAFKETVSIPAAKLRVYYVLMHSHVDIGYTDIQPHIAAKQAQNVVHALELIEKTKDYPSAAQFRWNVEVFWQVEQFYKIATPEQKQKFEQAVRERRIGLDAFYGNLLTGLARGEELLRQCEFSTELGRRCGVKVDSMMISDVPGLIWGVVPALAQAGVKYISDGPNAATGMVGDRIGYVRVQWENHPFAWESPSGKERAIYWGSQGGYSIGHHCGSIKDAIAELSTQLEEWGYPYDIVQLRWTKGDNGGPDETVMPTVRDWNKKYAWPKLIISTTSEMFQEFEKKYGDSLPVYRGDMTPYWEDGAGSSSRETGINRLSSDRMTQGETLWTLFKPQALPRDGYADALKNIAMYSEHTWGAHNSISAPDSDFVKAQWKIKQAFALDGETQTKKLLADAFATRGAAPEIANSVDVFNTASWPRTDLVTLPKTMRLVGDVVKDDQGKVAPSQRLASGELVFFAENIPPFGGRRFTMEAGKANPAGSAKADGLTLADQAIQLKLDAQSGAISSLRATGLDHEFVNPAAKLGLNEYIYLLGGDVTKAKRNGAAKVTVKENGGLVASLLVESDAPGCNKLLREVRLVSGLDRVEIIDTIDKKAVREVEGVHFGFGFDVPNAAVRINIPWGVIQPEKDQLAGACKNWFSVERWADVSNDELGVTWSTIEAPLLEVGGLTANLPRSQPNPKAYLSKIKASPTLYSWVMNNHWHTNYRADQDGETVFRYALRPHHKYDQVAAARFGIESTEPLLAAPGAGQAPAGSLVEIGPGPILITSIFPSPDGQALLVRLFNTGESAAQPSMKWHGLTPKAIVTSDLSGRPSSRGGALAELQPYEVRTLRAELQ
jgi:alpha-mannosidase